MNFWNCCFFRCLLAARSEKPLPVCISIARVFYLVHLQRQFVASSWIWNNGNSRKDEKTRYSHRTTTTAKTRPACFVLHNNLLLCVQGLYAFDYFFYNYESQNENGFVFVPTLFRHSTTPNEQTKEKKKLELKWCKRTESKKNKMKAKSLNK